MVIVMPVTRKCSTAVLFNDQVDFLLKKLKRKGKKEDVIVAKSKMCYRYVSFIVKVNCLMNINCFIRVVDCFIRVF